MSDIYTEIIKRNNGTRVKICVSFRYYMNEPCWSFIVYSCAAKKRTWVSTRQVPDLDVIRINKKQLRENIEKLMSNEEIQSAMDSAWKKLKPVLAT